ncbi:MAG: ABC transporter ATP-binding protein [Anaerolineales bacterium]|nr:ABC transporter ATP-binding protein [Anaerolineales bacterium]
MSDLEFREEEFTTQITRGTVFRILSLTRPHWPWLVGFMLTIAAVSALDAYFTFLSKQIVDDAILAENMDRLMQLLTIYGSMIVVQAANAFGFIYLAGVLGERIQYDLRKTAFNHLQELSLAYFNNTPVGWIMSRLTSDSERIASLVTWGLVDVTWGILNILTALAFMLVINWRLALMIAAIIPLIVVIAAKVRTVILVEYRRVRKINSKITGTYAENINGVRVVKALCREPENLDEFSQLTTRMYKASYHAAVLSALFLPLVQIISSLAVGATAWYGGWQSQMGLMSIGGIQAFISYITFMMWPIQDLARVYADMQHAVASAERVFSLIDSVPDIVDSEDAIDPDTIAGDIHFRDVSFRYESDKRVLKHFNLFVKQGETIALVGPTGGGKSTLVNLLCRFYEPAEGQILLGDHDYTTLSQKAIQSRIGIVLQTPHLFSGTIRENIRYGRLDASDEEVEAAARMTCTLDFIQGLEHGLDEQVGEGGSLLSVGQKQLISLARAVLSDPEIFIMDEATSSVDTITEALLQKGMEAVIADRTSFIIAHRLSTIKRADRIIVIEDGSIAEMGSHQELLRNKGKYYRLYTQQFRRHLEQQYDPFQPSSGVASAG